MRVVLSALFVPVLAAQAPDVQVVSVQERRLPNGVQVLLLERPGIGAFHARLLLCGGRSDTGHLPAASAELLTRTLFGPPFREKPDEKLETLLCQEEGAFESLRLERLRRQRGQGSEVGQEEENLAKLHEKLLNELKSRLEERSPDRLEEIGALNRKFRASADAIDFSLDLPKGAFDRWAKLEFQRLSRLDFSSYPLVKEKLIGEINQGFYRAERQRSVIFGTALAGWPYAQVAEYQVSALEAINGSDLRNLAHRLIVPDRLKLILVGDLKLDEVIPTLNSTFGKLTVFAEALPQREENTSLPDISAGNRRLQANFPGASNVYMAWRIPASNHPDESPLKLLTKVLEHRLHKRLQETEPERKLAATLEVGMGVPGWRMDCLILVEATPTKGHSLLELEEAIQGEVLRLQRELVPEDELRKGQRMLEAEPLLCQEDATTLANAIGDALVQTGDWRRAFKEQNIGRAILPLEIQAVARRYLSPERATVVLLEPDPLLSPRDLLEERLAKALTHLLQTRVEDPAKAQKIVRDTLRQLRMLSNSEREQTLKLLESRGRQ